MKIKENYKVVSIDKFQCKQWLLKKHYAKRMCSISYSFGLFNNKNILVGVCTFGYSANFNFNDGKCIFENYKCLTLELNRLITEDNLEKNVLSFFVSQSLKKLPSPSCVVSYSDQGQNHYGYIYQATNFLYTGISECIEKRNKYNLHSRHLKNKKDINFEKIKSIKHRYIFFNGNKKEIKNMKTNFKYEILPYPKGENKKYDASFQTIKQIVLFI